MTRAGKSAIRGKRYRSDIMRMPLKGGLEMTGFRIPNANHHVLGSPNRQSVAIWREGNVTLFRKRGLLSGVQIPQLSRGVRLPES